MGKLDKARNSLFEIFLFEKHFNKNLLWKNKRFYFLKNFFFSEWFKRFFNLYKVNKNFCETIIRNTMNHRSRAHKGCNYYLKKFAIKSHRIRWLLLRYRLREAEWPEKIKRRLMRVRMRGRLRKRAKFFFKKETHRFEKIRSYFVRCSPWRIISSKLEILQRLGKFFFFVERRLKKLKEIEEEERKRLEEEEMKSMEGKDEEDVEDEEGKDDEEKEELRIVHFKPNVVLSKIITDSYNVKKSLLPYKLQFLLNSVVKMDPIFFSFFFNKFIGKAMFAGKKNKFFFLVSSVFLLIKFFTALRPFYVFFSSLESSRVVVGHIPKKISGRVQIVPTYLYFGKQIQTAISLFVKILRKRQDFISSAVVENVNFKTKRLARLASLFVKNQKIYFSKLSKYTQRKNFVFDIIKKNYYIYISNRSNLQYRWR